MKNSYYYTSSPPLEVPPAKPTETVILIAKHLMKEIEDGCCIQLDIGGLPNVIGDMIADSDLKDLGLHTELNILKQWDYVMNRTNNGPIPQ